MVPAVSGTSPLEFALVPQAVGGDLPEVSRTTADATTSNLLGKTTRYDTTGGAISQTLPAATAGRVVAIGWDAGTNALSLTAAGSDVIGAGSATSLTVPLPGEVMTLHCTTAGRWRIVSGFKPQTSLDARFLQLAQGTPMRGTDGSALTVRSGGSDGMQAGVINWVHDGTQSNYLIHLTTSTNTAATAGLLAVGVDTIGYGLVAQNKKSGEGIRLRNWSTIDSFTAYGFHGIQESEKGPLVYLEQSAGSGVVAAPLLTLINQQTTPGAGQRLAVFQSKGQTLGTMYADTGMFEWRGGIVQVLGQRISSTSTTNTNTADRAEMAGNAFRFYRYGGSSKHYPWRIVVGENTTDLAIQAGNIETLGSETYDFTFIRFNRTIGGSPVPQIGFFGTTPVGRRTGWTTVPTGTATRTTFDTATVTLPQLAERVKALIDDLHATAGYGLLAA